MTSEEVKDVAEKILKANSIAQNTHRDLEDVNISWCDMNEVVANLQADIDTTANKIRIDAANVDLSDARLEKVIKGATIEERRLLKTAEGLYVILKSQAYGMMK